MSDAAPPSPSPPMPRIRLSSGIGTAVDKLFLPAVSCLASAVSIGIGIRGTETPIPWLLFALFAPATVYLTWPMKWVSVDDVHLHVRGLFREISVPLSEIVAVQRRRWLRPVRVFVRFRQPTPFGRYISFVAKVTFSDFDELTVAEDLRRLAGFADPDREWRSDSEGSTATIHLP